jgi:hypothetical protein
LKFLSDLLEPDTDHELVGRLFLKGLALIYVAAFASLAVQIDGLAGLDGILPIQQVLDRAFAEDGYAALWRMEWVGSTQSRNQRPRPILPGPDSYHSQFSSRRRSAAKR